MAAFDLPFVNALSATPRSSRGSSKPLSPRGSCFFWTVSLADSLGAGMFSCCFFLLQQGYTMVNYDHLPAASRYFDGKLYQNMNDNLQLAGMSKRTVHGYLRAVR